MVQNNDDLDDIRSDDPYRADAKALQDMGYDIERAGTRIIVTPGRTLGRMEELRFVVDCIESFGYTKIEASPSRAVFDSEALRSIGDQ